MYQAYKNRLPCLRINPNYAKEKALEYLERVKSSLYGRDVLIFLVMNYIDLFDGIDFRLIPENPGYGELHRLNNWMYQKIKGYIEVEYS